MRGSSVAACWTNGYDELAIGGDHAVAIANLAPIHKDPFDRMLVAQSAIEVILLLTADPIVAQYPGPVRKVSHCSLILYPDISLPVAAFTNEAETGRTQAGVPQPIAQPRWPPPGPPPCGPPPSCGPPP
jgi:hypothetical protein